jgi:hypothetical protein
MFMKVMLAGVAHLAAAIRRRNAELNNTQVLWKSGGAGTARSRIVTVVPLPGALLIEIVPP